ncbi:MAG: adenylosuccinate synthetase, partial [Saprospiraceae bacterium]|nr:adenylosuccinate synthetase [Saprospiraceae bacterium]
SSNTISAGVCTGLGVPPSSINEVIGITKAYCTRVGSGPFPTELSNEVGEKLRKLGLEFGATTGRPRRCGWLDLIQLKYVMMINGVTQLVMTKIDVLDEFDRIGVANAYQFNGETTEDLPFDVTDQIHKPVLEYYQGWGCSLDGLTTYDELPSQAQYYVEALEEKLGVYFSMISTGPEREKLVLRRVSQPSL